MAAYGGRGGHGTPPCSTTESSTGAGAPAPGLPMIERDRSLRALNTFGFEQTAERYAEAVDEDMLLELLERADRAHWPVLVLGGGSNVVLTRDVSGLVLRFVGERVSYGVASDDGAVRVTVEAGKGWHELVTETLERGLAGLENLALIPGSVGGAPVQNIGAYGVELAERLVSVRAWHRPGRRWHDLSPPECAFGYRDSRFKRERGDWVITAVTLELGPHRAPRSAYASLAARLAERGIDSPTPMELYDAVVALRRERLPDPARLGNAGSFFQNPIISSERAAALLHRFPDTVHTPQSDGRVKIAAGWLIDQLGFRGWRRGGVGVHEKQALVLVHEGGADADELLDLVERIVSAVRDRYGIVLEPEPIFI